MKKVEINVERLAELEWAARKLECLEAGGVDNWEWYSTALEPLRKEEAVKAAQDKFLENLNDVLAEAHVCEPAGRGCGYSVEFDEDFVRKALSNFLKEVQDEE